MPRAPRSRRTPRPAADKPERPRPAGRARKRRGKTANPAKANPELKGKVRLHKFMADSGVASRRACEELIAEGSVKVNGKVVTEHPFWVDPVKDDVRVDGRSLTRAQRHLYVMLYKPRRSVTTASDPDERRTVMEMVEHPSGIRLFPVGRLDYDTMGLILLTNDGELANRLTHPRYGVHKTYRAVVGGLLDDEAVEKLRRGIFMAERREGRTVGASRSEGADLRIVRLDRSTPGGRTILDITLREGRNRQVRRMLARVGCRVKKLTRIEMGPLRLKGLRVGEWRELTGPEVRELRRAAREADSAKGSKPARKRAEPEE